MTRSQFVRIDVEFLGDFYDFGPNLVLANFDPLLGAGLMDDRAIDEAFEDLAAVALHAFGSDHVVGDQLAVDACQRLSVHARAHRGAAGLVGQVFSGGAFAGSQELEGHRAPDHDDRRSRRDPGRFRALRARVVRHICEGRIAHRTCTPECRVLSAASMPPTIERSVARGRDYKTGAKTGQVVLVGPAWRPRRERTAANQVACGS